MFDSSSEEFTDAEREESAEYIVGAGASAGGLEALQSFLSNLPAGIDKTAIVIAQHLSPTYKSQLVDLLSRQTSLEVLEIHDNTIPLAGRIYITPPDREIIVEKGRFRLLRTHSGHGPRPSVDRLFHSLSVEKGEKAIGIIFSGTGSDGSSGIRDIKAEGGIVIVQDPETAKYSGMPQSAIATGHVDLMLSPDRIGKELYDICRRKPIVFEKEEDEATALEPLSEILQLLSRRTGTDFSRYKSATIGRRLDRRIAALGVDTIEEYLNVIKSRPHELDDLFYNILIGVTYFFRDPDAFQSLKEQLTALLQNAEPGERIRFWVAGCATGEEPYSLALLVADILGSKLSSVNLQIFATDIDEEALNFARKGIYPQGSLEHVPEHLFEKYFAEVNGGYEIHKNIRSMILFSRHDVTSNPPFLKLDMIACRNLLIYFGQELQRQVLPLFHYSLKPEGFLFLGKSETVGDFSDLFYTVDPKNKIYKRKRGGHAPVILPPLRSRGYDRQKGFSEDKEKERSLSDIVKETIFHSYEHPYAIINDAMDIIEISGDISGLLELKPGVMNTSLIKLAAPEIEIELRSLVSRSIRENQIMTGSFRRISGAISELLRIIVKPVLYTSGVGDNYYLVVFERLPVGDSVPALSQSVDQSNDSRVQELETELTSTKEHLQNYIEELETSSEELQSLNEELQSTNEELQSTNEELETSNEELQSTNEELQIAYTQLKAMNDEVVRQAEALRCSEGNIKALFNNTFVAFVLIDRDYCIVSYNEEARNLFLKMTGKGLEEKGLFLDLIPSSEIEFFSADFRKSIEGQESTAERKLKFQNGEEKWLVNHFSPVAAEDGVQVCALSVLDVTEFRELQIDLEDARMLNQLILDTTGVGICVTDVDGRFTSVNQKYCAMYGYDANELLGNSFTMVLPIGLHDYAARLHQRFLAGETDESAGEWQVLRRDGTTFPVEVTAGRMLTQDGRAYKVTTVNDISDRRQAEEERNRLFNVSVDMMAIMRYDGFLQQLNPAWESLGFSLDELMARPVVDFIYEDDRDHFIRELKYVIAEEIKSDEIEFRIRTNKGALRWFSCRYVHVPENRLLYLVARDVTDAQKYRELLKDTERVAHVGGWEIDVEADDVTWTEEVSRILEVNDDFPPGIKSVLEFFQPESRKIIEEALDKARDYGESSDVEVQLISKRGRMRWVRITMKALREKSKTVKIIGTFQDITERKQAEVQVRKLSLVASQTSNGVIITDGDYTIEYLNEGFHSISAYSEEDLRGENFLESLSGPELSGEKIAEIRQQMNDYQSFSTELRLYRKDRSDYWARLEITPVIQQDRAENYIIIVADITDKIRYEEDILSARDKAEEMNRLKTNFLANMSHEVRTPLNGILGLARIISDESDDAEIVNYAGLVSQSGQRLMHTINQVLDLSRIESNRTEIDIQEVNIYKEVCQIRDAMAILAREKRLELKLETEIKDVVVFTDSSMMHNILTNLVGNAIKFTENGGITIKVVQQVKDQKDYIRIDVIDSGVGISPDYYEKIFEPFTQESSGYARKHEGSGLGLSIAQRFAELLGGSIEFKSTKGKGSVFSFLVPVGNKK